MTIPSVNDDVLNDLYSSLVGVYETLPMRQGEGGWELFFTGIGYEIERDDELAHFPNDAAAVQHVTKLALKGNRKAIVGLALHWLEQLNRSAE